MQLAQDLAHAKSSDDAQSSGDAQIHLSISQVLKVRPQAA